MPPHQLPGNAALLELFYQGPWTGLYRKDNTIWGCIIFSRKSCWGWRVDNVCHDQPCSGPPTLPRRLSNLHLMLYILWTFRKSWWWGEEEGWCQRPLIPPCPFLCEKREIYMHTSLHIQIWGSTWETIQAYSGFYLIVNYSRCASSHMPRITVDCNIWLLYLQLHFYGHFHFLPGIITMGASILQKCSQ